MNDKQYKVNALKNNTFDVDAVVKSLEESRVNSYQYLKFIQSELTRYKRFDFKMQDIYRNNNINHKWSYVPRRWVQYIEYDFIDVSQRLAYKRSPYYEKDLSYNTVINNHKIFTNSFLVFIDGDLYTEAVNILCKEDKTYVIFICKEKPSDVGIPIDKMLDYIERNVNVTVIFLPNVGLTNISTNGYKLKGTNGYKGLPYRTMKLSENATYDDNVLAYVRYKNDLVSTPTTVSFGEDGLFVNSDSVQRSIDINPKDTTMNIQLIPLRYLYKKLTLDNKWFNLPVREYPISVKNCLVFDIDGNFLHEAEVKDYYPNVYSIENVDDIINEKGVMVYVFYYENKVDILKHINILDVYQKYVPNYLEKYKAETMIEEIKNYIPSYVNYSIKDYQQSQYYGYPFIYKVEKMREYIHSDVNNFRRYLDNLGLRNNYYYVDISKIDLETRKRLNNSDTGLPLKTFKEEMYMFVFRNDFRGMYDKLLIHVDGLRYETLEFYSNNNLDFVYVPCNLIKEDSILEIEKLTEVIKEFNFIGSEEITTIDIGEFAVRNKTLYNDLFIVDKETSLYLDPTSYKIYHPFNDIYELTRSLEYFESNDQAYFLGNLENGLLSIFEAENVNINGLESINVEDDITDEMYNLNIIATNDVDMVETEDEETTRYIKSHKDPNIMYKFIIKDGLVSIEEVTIDDKELDTAAPRPMSKTRSLNYDESIEILLNEVFLRCDRFVKIEILDEKYVGRPLVLHIKKNFKIAALEIRDEKIDQFEPISFKAASKNDNRYFRIYRNNRLVPRHAGGVFFPADYEYGDVDVYPGFIRNKNDHIAVEMMPYMMRQVCYLETIPNDKVIDLTGMIDKPFSFKWHDIYINGRKIPRRDVEIISANKIKLLKTDSLRWLEIIENSRDKEYFGYKPVEDIIDRFFELDQEFADNVNNSINKDNMNDIETPVVDSIITLLEYLIRRFFDEYLYKNFGLINPDINQIDDYAIKYYGDVISEDEPFLLNPDIGKVNAVVSMRINSDDK